MSALRLDEGLTLQKVIFRNSLRWSIYIINSGDKTKIIQNIIVSIKKRLIVIVIQLLFVA